MGKENHKFELIEQVKGIQLSRLAALPMSQIKKFPDMSKLYSLFLE